MRKPSAAAPEVTPVRMAFAMASYERTLFSDRAKIDRYAAEIEPMPADEARGKELFLSRFCAECHRGNLIGDNRFRYIGVRPDTRRPRPFETGRDCADLGKMRTQSLRNVALRGPFMHTGAFATLFGRRRVLHRGGDFTSPNKDSNFVKPMKLSDQEKADLLAFPRALAHRRPLAAEQALLFGLPGALHRVRPRPRHRAGRLRHRDHVLEPPVVGNPSFTVAVANAPGGDQATLVLDDTDPGPGPTIPATAKLFRGVAATEGADRKHASLSFPFPTTRASPAKRSSGAGTCGATTGASRRARRSASPFSPRRTRRQAPRNRPCSRAFPLRVFSARFSPESLVSGFGPNLSLTTQAATTLPLPTALGGVSILVRDSAGVEREAPLLFVSAGQINWPNPGRNGASARRRFPSAGTARPLHRALASRRGRPGAVCGERQRLRICGGAGRPRGRRRLADNSAVAEFDSVLGRYVAAPVDVSGDGAVLVP
ncbi:MAG: c-type cytochrome [Bryobacterales bacterium]